MTKLEADILDSITKQLKVAQERGHKIGSYADQAIILKEALTNFIPLLDTFVKSATIEEDSKHKSKYE